MWSLHPVEGEVVVGRGHTPSHYCVTGTGLFHSVGSRDYLHRNMSGHVVGALGKGWFKAITGRLDIESAMVGIHQRHA
jgi:hypothetical protein